jgi:hypothetical protein
MPNKVSSLRRKSSHALWQVSWLGFTALCRLPGKIQWLELGIAFRLTVAGAAADLHRFPYSLPCGRTIRLYDILFEIDDSTCPGRVQYRIWSICPFLFDA